MKSTIRKNVGLTELLLILPLFTGILCVIAWVGFLMIQKTKMEKNAWQIQTRKTYRMSNPMKTIDPNYTSQSNRSWMDWARLGNQTLSAKLPLAFAAYIATHPQKNESLSLHGFAPLVFQHLKNASFKDDSDIRSYEFETEMVSSGPSMDHSGSTKKGMWLEAMKDSGFDYYDLRSVGYKEITGIPIQYVDMALDMIKLLKEKL